MLPILHFLNHGKVDVLLHIVTHKIDNIHFERIFRWDLLIKSITDRLSVIRSIHKFNVWIRDLHKSRDNHHNSLGSKDKCLYIEHSHESTVLCTLGSNHSQGYIVYLKQCSHFHNLLLHPLRDIRDYNFFLQSIIPFLSCRRRQKKKDEETSFLDFNKWICNNVWL